MKQWKTLLARKQGFTLVELIIVVSIIAILAALSFIALSGETANARDTKRASDLKTIEDAISQSNAKSKTIAYGNATSVVTNAGITVSGTRGANISAVSNVVFDSTILPQAPVDPRELAYVAAFLSSNLYQLAAVKENADTGTPTAVVQGSFRAGSVVDRSVNALTTSDTTVTVLSSNRFVAGASAAAGDIITIDSEDMLVTAVDTTAKTLTVTRAQNSTVAATHLPGASIKIKAFPTDGTASSLFCVGAVDASRKCGAAVNVVTHGGTVLPYSITQ